MLLSGIFTTCCHLLLIIAAFARAEENVVSTTLGKISGKPELTLTGKPYHAYYSIPYAKPPTGDRRFRVLNT